MRNLFETLSTSTKTVGM